MENLNAEAVKKALECCVKSECSKCPLRDGRCANGEMGRLSLTIINSQEQRIKELTEENDKLYRLVDDKIQECEKWKERLKIECEYTEKITVKKMHSMLCEGRVSNDNVVIVANQVTKEMLEGV